MKRIILATFIILLPFQCYSNYFVSGSGGITIPDIQAQDNFKQGIGLTLQTGMFVLNKKAFVALSWDYLISEYFAIVPSDGNEVEIINDARFSNITLSFNYFVYNSFYANIGIGNSTFGMGPKYCDFGDDSSYQLDAPTTNNLIFVVGVGYLQPVFNVLSLKLDIYQVTDFNKWSNRNNINFRAGILFNL